MDPRYVAAIEIGSSKIKGAIASIDPATDMVQVLAVVTTPLTNSVRYGRVQNVQNVVTAVNDILRRLENDERVAPRKITHVYISLGGRSLATINVSSELKLQAEVQITQEIINRLKREAQFEVASPKRVISVEPRRYFVGNQEVKNIVGIFGQNLRGDFTAVVCSPENIVNLDRIKLESDTDAEIERTYITRIEAIADMALTDSERTLGCMLLDVGAETTTVAIYKEGNLRFISTLPLGGRNITLDVSAGLSITEDDAEYRKRTIGSAVSSSNAPDQSLINNYVSARAGEIIANAFNQLSISGFKAADLPEGIVATGGCFNLPGFDAMLTKQTNMTVRHAGIDDKVMIMAPGISREGDIDVIALLRYAAINHAQNCLTELPEPEPEPQDHYNSTGRNIAPDDDDNILRDDEDDDDGRRSGFFGGIFSGKKNKKQDQKRQKSQYKAQPEPEPEPEDDYPDDQPDDDQADSPVISGISRLGRIIFGGSDKFGEGEDQE